jgi:hypothetical protein
MTKPIASIPKRNRIYIGDQLQKHLISRGLPRDILRLRPFDLSQHVVSIVSEVEGLKTRKIPKLQQIEHYQALCNKPFGKPYIYIIGSSPNDGKAKQVAAHLMECATHHQLKNHFPRSTRGRQSPLWHFVTGNFPDRLRDSDGTSDQPSMLILSNITKDSTAVKLEKVRDLLEIYNHIPRVVVVTGEDPITFANTRLLIQVHYAMMLATAMKILGKIQSGNKVNPGIKHFVTVRRPVTSTIETRKPRCTAVVRSGMRVLAQRSNVCPTNKPRIICVQKGIHQ